MADDENGDAHVDVEVALLVTWLGMIERSGGCNECVGAEARTVEPHVRRGFYIEKAAEALSEPLLRGRSKE